jgi:hypothetical protein
MIKKYNQFVKGKVNEDFTMADPETKPVTAPPTTTPDTRPSRPGVVPTTIPSEQDAPLAKYEQEEEEGGEYIGKKMMNDLSSELGTEIDEDGSINYNGKKVNFYSETEKFHVDKKKFDTVEDVLNYLDGSNSPKMTPEEENEMTGEREGERRVALDDIDEDEFEDDDVAFESKSYKNLRLKKFKK